MTDATTPTSSCPGCPGPGVNHQHYATGGREALAAAMAQPDEVCIAELGGIVTGPYPTPAELLAERFGPGARLQRDHNELHNDPTSGAECAPNCPGASRPATDRVHAIAAIHALADFYTAHPEVPRPWLVRAHSGAENADELQRIADEHRATTYGRGPQLDIVVQRGRGGADPDGPTWVEIIVSVPADGERPL